MSDILPSGLVVEVEKVIDPIVADVKADVTKVVATVEADTKPNVIASFFKDVWNKIVSVDTAINTWVSSITSGYTTLVLVVIAVAYWLLPVKAILEIVLAVPNAIKSFILVTLVPFIATVLNTVLTLAIDAIPYVIGVAIIAIAIVEAVNAIKKLIK